MRCLFLLFFFSMNMCQMLNAQRVFNFSGYGWTLKNSGAERVGPGNNLFSGANVSLNDAGELVLELTKQKGDYYCAEVISQRSFGYGTYIFTLGAMPEALHKNVVLGLFTYNTSLPNGGTEIDIEVSQWGKRRNKNSQYVLHKDSATFDRHRFITPALSNTIHMFTWYPDSIVFRSFAAVNSAFTTGKPYMTYVIKSKTEVPSGEKVHINFWLYGKGTPFMRKHKVVISRFSFVSLDT